MLRTITTTTLFLFLLASGGAWAALHRFLPSTTIASLVVIMLGIGFVAIYLWLTITRIRNLLRSTDHLIRNIGLLGVDVALLIVVFAWSYHVEGIRDTMQPEPTMTNDLLTCIYFSIVTFTTLGYGDFYPQGVGRALAGLEAITGYLILGLLASTGASILSPHEAPKLGTSMQHDEQTAYVPGNKEEGS
ncbi:MAG TPA: potassium channel family protein [Roseiflexaceae bacterium]|jgi:hypothetical protein|nr:potassium channel family protein [Roseiflexaceae bacterium]